jgi:hypothetical protein
MANPVNNNGILVKAHVGNLLNVDARIGGSARNTDNQSTKAIQNVNDNLNKNPNHTRPVYHAEDADGKKPETANLKNDNQDQINRQGTRGGKTNDTAEDVPRRDNRTDNDQTQNKQRAFDPKGNRNNQVDRGEDGHHVNHGTERASDRGLQNGRGHHKGNNNGQNQTNSNNGQNQTPIKKGQNQVEFEKPQNQTTETTPRNNRGNHEVHTENHKDRSNHHENHPNNRPNFQTPRNANAGTKNNQNLGEKFSIELNVKANGNQPKGVIRAVVNQVLQQNDIYLKNNAVNKLVSSQTTAQAKSQSQIILPHEVNNLVQNISKCVVDLLSNPQSLNGKMIQHISAEISHQLQEQVQTAKNGILKNADLGATPFKHLNIGEKMHVAVELMPPHLPEKALENLQNCKTQDILNGMLIARGMIVPGEKLADIQNLASFKSNVLPNDVSMKNLRDVGQLVKILIADSAAAKSTANLDLAVQKFVRILLANNELGVLLATVNLASQTTDRGGLVSRSIALAQIYELIASLQAAGEKAMKNAAQTNKIEQKMFEAGVKSTVEDKDDIKNQASKQKTSGLESALRQFLEFNPALALNKSASSFHNPDDARQAQKDFVSLYHNDIDQWLQSGNHRFVKDINFEKPVGVVVERNKDGFFTANTARIVLVRDGSVQGWHFLKSFLVK